MACSSLSARPSCTACASIVLSATHSKGKGERADEYPKHVSSRPFIHEFNIVQTHLLSFSSLSSLFLFMFPFAFRRLYVPFPFPMAFRAGSSFRAALCSPFILRSFACQRTRVLMGKACMSDNAAVTKANERTCVSFSVSSSILSAWFPAFSFVRQLFIRCELVAEC